MRSVMSRKGRLPKWMYALVKAERWLGRGSPVTSACSGRGGLACVPEAGHGRQDAMASLTCGTVQALDHGIGVQCASVCPTQA